MPIHRSIKFKTVFSGYEFVFCYSMRKTLSRYNKNYDRSEPASLTEHGIEVFLFFFSFFYGFGLLL